MNISKNEIQEGLKRYPFIKKDFEKYEVLDDTYYHILTDLLLYPSAWAYFVWSSVAQVKLIAPSGCAFITISNLST